MTPEERVVAATGGADGGATGGGVEGVFDSSIAVGASILGAASAAITAPTAAAAPVTTAGARRWLALTGGTTVMGGGVFGNGVASRSTLFARMMRLERLAGAKGPGGTGTGETEDGGRTTVGVGMAGGATGLTGGGTVGEGTGDAAATGAGGVETTTGAGGALSDWVWLRLEPVGSGG